MRLVAECSVYVVVMSYGDGRHALGSGDKSPIATFRRWDDARDYLAEARKYGLRGRVRKATMKVTLD